MIRTIQEADIAQCLAIYNHYILNSTATYEEEALTLKSFAERVKSITTNYPWLVYEEGGEILGYAYLNYFNPRSAYRICADLSIYVAKQARTGGIGSSLYQEIEKLAKNQGITKLVSLITDENSVSLRFHEKMGFKKAGHLEGVAIKFNRLLGVEFYLKDLNDTVQDSECDRQNS